MWPFTRRLPAPPISLADAQELIRNKEIAVGREPRTWWLNMKTHDIFCFDSDEDLDDEALVDRHTGNVAIRYGD